MSSYRFGDLVEITGVARNILKRWTAIGLIQPQGTGSPEAGWRKFTLRNLVETRVCAALHAVEMTETVMAAVVRALQSLWDGTTVWVETSDGEFKSPGDVSAYCLCLRHVPSLMPDGYLITFYDPARLGALVAAGGDESGPFDAAVIVPVSRIIVDLETQTGDVFDLRAFARRVVTEAIAKADKKQ